jgi:hypothetical protein
MTIQEHSKLKQWNRSGNYRKTNNFDCSQFGWPKPYQVLDTPEDDFKPEHYPDFYHCAICEAGSAPVPKPTRESLCQIFEEITGIVETIELQEIRPPMEFSI